MKRAILILGLLIVVVFTFTSCKNDPSVSVHHSIYSFDDRNIYIKVEDAYETDYYNSYEWVDTENGKDLVIHYVKVKE